MSDKKTRLMLDFKSREGLAAFLDEFLPLIQKHVEFEVGVWNCDASDFSATHGGVGRKNTFIVAPADDARMDRFQVDQKRTY